MAHLGKRVTLLAGLRVYGVELLHDAAPKLVVVALAKGVRVGELLHVGDGVDDEQERLRHVLELLGRAVELAQHDRGAVKAATGCRLLPVILMNEVEAVELREARVVAGRNAHGVGRAAVGALGEVELREVVHHVERLSIAAHEPRDHRLLLHERPIVRPIAHEAKRHALGEELPHHRRIGAVVLLLMEDQAACEEPRRERATGIGVVIGDDLPIGVLQLEERVHVVQREAAHHNCVHRADGAEVQLILGRDGDVDLRIAGG